MSVSTMKSSKGKPPMSGDSAHAPNSFQSAHLYERVADRITHLIDQGTLRPGDRVPSIRKLVRQQSGSVSTVLQAYQLLEGRGLIEARPKSGIYVRARRWTPAPEPEIFRPAVSSKKLNMAGLVMEVVGALIRPGLVNFGVAVPPPELLPTRELHRSLAGTPSGGAVQWHQHCPRPDLLGPPAISKLPAAELFEPVVGEIGTRLDQTGGHGRSHGAALVTPSGADCVQQLSHRGRVENARFYQ